MSSRLSLKAYLRPHQGQRFQPTGFPDLGPAEYLSTEGKTQLLVESHQSMANRLEEAVWDSVRGDLIPALRGMPYVLLRDPEHGLFTTLSEANRLASPYLEPYVETTLKGEWGEGSGHRPLHKVAPALLRLDPNSLLHGVFFPSLGVRVTRILSAFIEASEASAAISGGVRFDRVDPSGPAKDKKGHLPFSRREYISASIVAYFSLDLVQLESCGLSPTAEEFLRDLAMLKVARFLQRGLRLRTACDFEVIGVEGEMELDVSVLSERVKGLIPRLVESGEFGPVWDVTPS